MALVCIIRWVRQGFIQEEDWIPPTSEKEVLSVWQAAIEDFCLQAKENRKL